MQVKRWIFHSLTLVLSLVILISTGTGREKSSYNSLWPDNRLGQIRESRVK